MSLLKKVRFCPICNKKMKFVFKMGSFPLCDDLIKIGSKKKSKLYPIVILACKRCILICNKYQVNAKILFPKNYHYRSRFTDDVNQSQVHLVKKLTKKFGNLKKKKILDIGCNDGSLLDKFKKSKSITIGIEPTNAADESSKSHRIFKNYFNIRVAKRIKKEFGNIDFVTFTNVFAHINDFEKLLESLKFLISKRTILVIENHYFGSIIEHSQFDTFYHEHPRTYSLKSFLNISRRLGLNINDVEFTKRYGGNIRVIISSNIKKKKSIKFFLKKKRCSKKFLI